jgi:hypothetical protein
MTAAPRLNWLFRVALACAAMVCVLLVGASMAGRPLPPTPQSAQGAGTSLGPLASEGRALAVNHVAPSDHASSRPASTTRAAWQRSGGRRTQRTASSQIPVVERTPGIMRASASHQRRGQPAMARLVVFRRDGRLGSAPTRAPPHHR